MAMNMYEHPELTMITLLARVPHKVLRREDYVNPAKPVPEPLVGLYGTQDLLRRLNYLNENLWEDSSLEDESEKGAIRAELSCRHINY